MVVSACYHRPDENRAKNESCRGVSIVEILIVVAMIAIITAISVIQFTRTADSYDADNAAYKILNYCREANGRAVSDHHSYRVVINTNTGNISLINEVLPTTPTGATCTCGEGDTVTGTDVLVKQEPVGTRVSFTQPTAITTLPPSPYNYAAATFSGGQWTAHFNSNGSVVDPWSSQAPLSCTIFVSPADLQTQLGLVRAVTIFTSSGSVRYWMYMTGSGSFVQG
jgi:Tfp pilus assembly protein FimT